LSLAIGLGSRDLVSRSIERNTERNLDIVPVDTPAESEGVKPPTPIDSLRHF